MLARAAEPGRMEAAAAEGITFVGQVAQTQAAASGVNSISLPAGTTTGDLVIVVYGSDSATPTGLSSPGYTNVYVSGSGAPEARVHYKIMGATPDTEVQITNQAGSTFASVAIVQVWRGVHQTNPIDATRTVAEANSATPDAPTYTTVTDGARIFAVGVLDDIDVASSIVAPTGYGNLLAADCGVGGSTGGATVMIASKVRDVAGAENPPAFTGSATLEDWDAITFALRSASATPPVVGGGVLVYEWAPQASWIDGVALTSRDADNVLELSRWTNPSAAVVGSGLPIEVFQIGGLNEFCFNRAPDGSPALEIHTTLNKTTSAFISLAIRLYAQNQGVPRHLRVAIELYTCKSTDPTTYKAQGKGTTSGAYPDWANTHAGADGVKYFIGQWHGIEGAGGGNWNWWDYDSVGVMDITKAGYRYQFGSGKAPGVYAYNYNRPNRYGGSQDDGSVTATVEDGIWNRWELEVKLTDPAGVPAGAIAQPGATRPSVTNMQYNGGIWHYRTRDLTGTPGAREQFTSATGAAGGYGIITSPAGVNDANLTQIANPHQTLNLGGVWIYLAHGGSVPSQAEGWAWIRRIQVYRHD